MAEPRYTAEEVRFVQQVLHVPVTGVFDQQTYTALVLWQRDKGIGVSGQIDLATTSAMAAAVQQIARLPIDPIDQKILEQYGPALYAYRMHGEIGPILRWAAAANYDDERLWGLLEKTDWYRTTSDDARRWDDLNVTDPSTANARRDEQMSAISDAARSMGLYIVPMDLQNIAEDALRFGWSEGQITDVLASYIPAGGQGLDPGGTVAVDAATLRQNANAWMVSFTDAELQDMAARITRGELTMEGADLLMRERAKARFPYANLGELIDDGIKPADYFGEHQARIASRLGLPQQAVDWDEARWGKILDFVDDKGNRRPMTIPEALAYIADPRLFPEYDRSPQTTAQTATLLRDLRETFEGVR